MKKTQFKDTRKNIKKEIVSYLSIMLIAALAVTAYLGINFAAKALQDNGDTFYTKHNFRDIELTSTLLLNQKDIEAMKATEGVADIEGIYAAAGTLDYKTGHAIVNVISLSERINTVELMKGRLPQGADECALEEELFETYSLSIGDKIKVSDDKGSILTYLKSEEFVITGSVRHPDHISKSIYVPGDRYVIVSSDAFDKEALEDCYMKALIKVSGTEKLSFFSNEYNDLVKTVKTRLEPIKDQQAKEREAFVKDKIQSAIDEGQQKLDEGKKLLEDGRRQLDENTKKLEDGEKQLAEAKQKLEDGKKELDNGRSMLETADKEIASAREQLTEGKAKLDEGEKELAAATVQINEAKAKLDDGKAQLDQAYATLDEANNTLLSKFNEIEDYKKSVRTQIRSGVESIIGFELSDQLNWASPSKISDAGNPESGELVTKFYLTDNLYIDFSQNLFYYIERPIKSALEFVGAGDRYDEIINLLNSDGEYQKLKNEYGTMQQNLLLWKDSQAQYISGVEQYKQKEAEYKEGLALYNSGYAEYEKNLALFNEGKAQYEEKLAEFNSKVAEVEAGRKLLEEKQAEYDEGLKKYREGADFIEESRKTLADGEQQYSEKLKEYEKGLEDLEEAKRQLRDLPPCYFVMVDKSGNGGFGHINYASQNLGKIGITFALLFVVVGALIIYVTVGRIVNEQRTLLGAQKALGFFNKEIFAKYLTFGVSSTLLGILLGTVMGFAIVQRICIFGHERFYAIDSYSLAFVPLQFVIVLFAGVAISALAVWIACRSLLKQSATQLMMPELPKAKRKTNKKSGVNAKASGSTLYSRLIFRNIFTDMGRVITTIVSIAGCCTLLVIGFLMNNSVTNTINGQYDRYNLYDEEIYYNLNTSDTAEKDITEALAANGVTGLACHSKYYSFDSTEGMDIAVLFSCDLDEISKYNVLKTADSAKPFTFDGLLIPYKFAESFRINVGDEMTVYDTDMTPRKVKVSGIYDNYMGRNIYMSKEVYKAVFGKEAENNKLMLKTDKTRAELENIVSKIPGFSSIKSKAEEKTQYSSIVGTLNLITAVLIVSAGLLAFFVLLNLINMYLNRKKRELTVMRINGFFTKEVIRYVAMESIVTTVLGIILGSIIGTIIGNVIVYSLEQPSCTFAKGVNFIAIGLGALITFVFSAAINAIALRKVRHLKLTDI